MLGKKGALLLGVALTTLLMVIIPASAGNPGAIWTTKDDCGSEQQDVNHFATGDHVFINGAGFDPGTYSWKIKGKPGGASGDPNVVVAGGNFTVDGSGAFCFDAYTVKADDWGEYQVKFGNKGDNYRVEGVEPTKTPRPTKTPGPTHTPEPTNTLVPTVTNTPVPTDTNTPLPTATGTLPPATATLTRTATLSPATRTETLIPTLTSNPAATDTQTNTPTETSTSTPTACMCPTEVATATSAPTCPCACDIDVMVLAPTAIFGLPSCLPVASDVTSDPWLIAGTIIVVALTALFVGFVGARLRGTK